MRGRNGNWRNFSHGIIPNDSVAKIYDNYLGLHSPLRDLEKEQEKPRCKKKIDPHKINQLAK